MEPEILHLRRGPMLQCVSHCGTARVTLNLSSLLYSLHPTCFRVPRVPPPPQPHCSLRQTNLSIGTTKTTYRHPHANLREKVLGSHPSSLSLSPLCAVLCEPSSHLSGNVHSRVLLSRPAHPAHLTHHLRVEARLCRLCIIRGRVFSYTLSTMKRPCLYREGLLS